MMSERQIKEKINNLRRELAIYEEIVNTPSDGKMGRPSGDTKYTTEQIKFLRENKGIPMEELILLFNKTFDRNLNPNTRALYNFMCRQGIISFNSRGGAI